MNRIYTMHLLTFIYIYILARDFPRPPGEWRRLRGIAAFSGGKRKEKKKIGPPVMPQMVLETSARP